ncbi:MAG TPA: hypothetical protein VGA20_03415 [Gemmatimonadales bacterium]
MRAVGRLGGWVVAIVCLLTAHPPIRLSAQDSMAVRDTVARIGPLGAMWRSMVLPGWGQAVTERHTMGAIFVAWEGVTIMMTFKTQGEADYLREVRSPLLEAKEREFEDWLVLWVFNHLFSGAEALVSAHLRDFPPDLRLRAVPGGIAVSLPLPRF